MKLFLLLLGLGGMSHAAVPVPPPADTVVLLHGLGRTSFSMARIACDLDAAGYRVINATYPSRSVPLETLATAWLPAQLQNVAPGSRVHFVTHSMGGILVRLWLRDCGAPANPGRVVMLAPPNTGSELTDRLARWAPFRWFTGLNGRRLGTSPGALPRALGDWPAEGPALGVIAGDHSINPVLGSALPAPNDGKVSVASTHLTGESDHLVLPYSHTWLAWHRATLTHVSAFLRTGAFGTQPTGSLGAASGEAPAGVYEAL